MVEAVTAQEMQRFDRYTMEEIGVPALVLMERAAMATIEVLAAGTFDLANVLVIAGLGNNGVAIARMLIQKALTSTY